MFEIVCYQREEGSEPYTEWFRKLRDGIAKAAIAMRLGHLKGGNFGDCKAVGQGVQELRIHTGPDFGVDGMALVILLLGGDKSTQTNDIPRPKRCGRNGRRGSHETACWRGLPPRTRA